MRICVEASGLSAWAERILVGLGHEVVVANAQRVRLIAESTLKNDAVDAETLARLVRMDVRLLRPIQHRSERTQRLRGMLRSFGYRVPGTTIGRLAQTLATREIPEELLALVAPLVATALELDEKIQGLDHEVKAVGAEYPEVGRLQTIPGVGPLVALAYVLCLEDPARFRRSRDVAGFVGLRPRMRESGQTSRFGSITKTGDAEMRRLLVQAAHGCLRTRQDSDLKRWAEQLAARIGKKKAVVALARKLAVVMHAVWLRGEDFRPLQSSEPAAA
jgi:transposase